MPSLDDVKNDMIRCSAHCDRIGNQCISASGGLNYTGDFAHNVFGKDAQRLDMELAYAADACKAAKALLDVMKCDINDIISVLYK